MKQNNTKIVFEEKNPQVVGDTLFHLDIIEALINSKEAEEFVKSHFTSYSELPNAQQLVSSLKTNLWEEIKDKKH